MYHFFHGHGQDVYDMGVVFKKYPFTHLVKSLFTCISHRFSALSSISFFFCCLLPRIGQGDPMAFCNIRCQSVYRNSISEADLVSEQAFGYLLIITTLIGLHDAI
jgi:hypothetical protein